MLAPVLSLLKTVVNDNGGTAVDGAWALSATGPTPISGVMTANCVTVGPEMMAAEAVKLMETRKINGLLVVDEEKRPLGAFNMHDLLKAGVI